MVYSGEAESSDKTIEIRTTSEITASIVATGSLFPDADNVYDLGKQDQM